jgi:hypothetical protein
MVYAPTYGAFSVMYTKNYNFQPVTEKPKIESVQDPKAKTLYSDRFDNSVPYYVYYPYGFIARSKVDEISDKNISILFEKLLEKFTIKDLLFHISVCKGEEYKKSSSADSDNESVGSFDESDDEHAIENSSKYVRRYDCDCYNWICDACLEEEEEERIEAIKYVINQRYVLTALYEVSPDAKESLKIVADFVKNLVDKYLTMVSVCTSLVAYNKKCPDSLPVDIIRVLPEYLPML